MALAKDITVQDSQIGFLQSCSIYSNVYGEITGPSPVDFFSLENQKLVQEESECSGDLKFSSSFNYPPVLDYSLNSGVFSFQNSNSDLNRWVYSSGSILNFEQEARLPHSIRPDSIGKNGYRLAEDQNCFETATDCNLLDNKHGEKLKWLDSGSRVGDCLLSFGKELECNFVNKRAYMDGENTNNVQVPKKQCNTVHRKPKLKPLPSKDPQSIAAKNRRERISERLKILQDLVPNGTKVDLVTMLEKAISYVKFLQLQVKVLATDEFWPVQGGKAPEITQVKEAMDEILSSHIRTRNEKEAPNQ